ncbi:hypothetical protein C2S51_026774 [Perilla frutescens var. frutescens]|nr:hypothetical protein C2S51_026774 [Perilla frutescens var. frutescens]
MDVEKVFHMKGGLGDTSYYKNSSIQKSVGEKMKEITLEAIEETYYALRPQSVGIADLGCSTGFNSLLYTRMIVDAVERASRAIEQASPEFRLCLNDLPSNDFNTIFQALPNFYEELKKKATTNPKILLLVAAYPGNFYGRLFPGKSLHFVFSLSSLHWLSRIPRGIFDKEGRSLNKNSIYITEKSPPQVCEAYAKQFEEDFAVFLDARSEEVVTDGRMVLVMTARNRSDYFSGDNTFLWELLYQSFLTLVHKGRIEEERVESYDVHYYEPCKQEIQDIVTKQGSFKLDRLEILEKDVILSVSGVAIAKTVRAVQESMISLHFGEGILDELFDEYGKLLEIEKATKKIKVIDIALVLRKL